MKFRRIIKRFLPDIILLKLQYRKNIGKKLNLNNPVLFNEKLQWLKLYDRNPIYTKLVDKYEVRNIVAEKIGEKYLIPLHGLWKNVEEIDFDALPNQFVLKCTHDSGSVIICKDKSIFDAKKAKEILKKKLKRNYYYHGRGREWPYKNVQPRIICEKYMVDESGTGLKDYKIFCFNGEPKFIDLHFDRFINHKSNVYDTEWNFIPVSTGFPFDEARKFDKPDNLQEILDIAKILSKDIPHVRVDLYSTLEKAIYFGELTLTDGSGLYKYEPEEFAVQMGNWLTLPTKYTK